MLLGSLVLLGLLGVLGLLGFQELLVLLGLLEVTGVPGGLLGLLGGSQGVTSPFLPQCLRLSLLRHQHEKGSGAS